LFTPVILATQEAEIRGITVQSQPGKIVHETLTQKKQKNPSGKRAGRVNQGVGSEFKPRTAKKEDIWRQKETQGFMYIVYRKKSMRGHEDRDGGQRKAGRGFRRNQPANNLVLKFQPPDVRSKFLSFKPPGLCYFVIVT
jgi:hypothetical protein